MTLDLAQFLLRTVLFVFVYILAVTTSGAFKAWVAYLCGDDTPKEQGLLTFNPLMHMDPLGLFFLLFFNIGWGRRVPIDASNIPDRKKLFVAYWADTFMHIVTAIVALVILVGVFGPGILQSSISYVELRAMYPQYASFAFVNIIILIFLIRFSVWLAALSGITNFFKLMVILFFPEKQDDPDAQYFINFAPLLIMILFLQHIMNLITILVEHAGFVVASLLRLI